MEVICFAQNKGGQAKTSSCFELAYGLNKAGYKVLTIDLDSQGNQGILANVNNSKGTFEVLTKKENINDLLQDYAYGKILPGNDDLSMLEYKLPEGGEDDLFLLYDALQQLDDDFDFILIDCGPSLSVLTMNGLVAADTVIVPSTADELSLHGMVGLAKTLNVVKRSNPDLKVEGILITRWNGQANLNRQIAEAFEEAAKGMKSKVFNSRIRESVRLREAQMNKKAVQEYEPKANPAIDYAAFLEEFMNDRKEMVQ